jgi:hypothetical protein
MKRRFSYLVEQSCTAPCEVVYAVLEGVERWPLWMPGVSAASWEQTGALTTAGAGAVRSMKAHGIAAREQIIAAEPPHLQTYTMLSGLPVRDYLGNVRIADRSGGSFISWEATFTSRLPGTGHLIRRAMASSITKVAAALAREATRKHGTWLAP